MNTLRLKRRLCVIEGCPQPDPPTYKPIVYGAPPWGALPHNPPAQEVTIRARAQSILSRDGQRAELPTYEDALRIIADADRDHRVTVPQPKG